MRLKDTLRGAPLVALGMVLSAYHHRRPMPTGGDVAKKAGVSRDAGCKALLRLKELGLIAWDGPARTIKPTCYVTLNFERD